MRHDFTDIWRDSNELLVNLSVDDIFGIVSIYQNNKWFFAAIMKQEFYFLEQEFTCQSFPLKIFTKGSDSEKKFQNTIRRVLQRNLVLLSITTGVIDLNRYVNAFRALHKYLLKYPISEAFAFWIPFSCLLLVHLYFCSHVNNEKD